MGESTTLSISGASSKRSREPSSESETGSLSEQQASKVKVKGKGKGKLEGKGKARGLEVAPKAIYKRRNVSDLSEPATDSQFAAPAARTAYPKSKQQTGGGFAGDTSTSFENMSKSWKGGRGKR